MSLTVDADDLGRLIASIEANVDHIDDRAAQVVRKTALDMEQRAKVYAPVDTGFLQNSIHTEESVNSSGVYGMDVIAGADYSDFVEHGTSRMAPQPFMRPAADEVRPGYEAAMAQLANPLDPR